MYTEILGELGFAKNESFIYVALVKTGGMGIASIALKSGVHRRNVYDSMQRLLEKGLVYEEIGDRENKYYAVDPHKLLEMVEEKRNKVESLMPELLKQFSSSASEQSVVIYRGVEGVKNYIRLMEHEGKEIYLYGALGGSLSPKVVHTFERLLVMLTKKNLPANVLYRNSVAATNPNVIGHLGPTSRNRILSKEFSDISTYTIFGEYVCMQSGEYTEENFAEKGEVTLFIIKSRGIAEMMKLQFSAVWEVSEDAKKFSKR